MTDWIFIISNIATAWVRAAAGLYLISRILSTERLSLKTITAAGTGMTVICLIFHFTSLPEFYRFALEAVWITICSRQLQHTDTRLSLFLGIFYEIAAAFWQFLVSAWLGVLFHSSKFLDVQMKQGQTAVWIFYVILILLILYLSRKQDMTAKAGFRIASAIGVAGFLGIVTLTEQKTLFIEDETLDMWMILALVFMMAVLIYNMRRQYEMEKELAKLKTEQAELLERDYTTLNRAYEINAKLFHDFHNHIGILRQFLSRGKTKEAVEYLDELQAPVREMTDTVWTGDETVDYLINSKAAAAKDNDIQFTVQVEFPKHMNIKSIDLCAILGNLLDNALEAAGQASDPKRKWIRLTIRRIHQMLVIKIENGLETALKQENGNLKTTKEENGLHGWGLKSAQTAAEKYEGMVQTSHTEDTFYAVATLSYQAVSVET